MNKNNRLHNRTRLPRFASGALALGAALLVAPLGLAQEEEEEEIFELSPFTVEASEDSGYRATSTLAGTRIRTNLRDVGSAISVMTDQFLSDTNSNNATDLLVYATSFEVAGQNGNFVGQGDGRTLDTTNRESSATNTRVRGLAAADNTRNYYLTDIPWDGYNVDRVDIQRGPNSVLFGIGSPAGIVNTSLSAASFEDHNEVEFQYGRFGSTRLTGKFNKVIIEDELAARVAMLRDETNYRQDPAFRDDTRIYGAITWKPKMFSGESYNTEISASYENGSVDSNNPRILAPLDAISPWFGALNKGTYAGPQGFQYTTQDNDPATVEDQWLGAAGGRLFGGMAIAMGSGAAPAAFMGEGRAWPDRNGGKDAETVREARIVGINTYDLYSSSAGLAGTSLGAAKAKSITDPNIFDFYNQLLEGPNKSEFNDFDAFNVALRQNFFNNKLGYELAYDKQDAEWGYQTLLASDAAAITIDVNESFADGTANPNVGRPMVVAGGGSAGAYWQHRERETLRATVYGEYDFADSGSDTLEKILGRHVFTGLYSEARTDNMSLNRSRYFLSPDFGPNSNGPVGDSVRDVHLFSYLGGSLVGASSASDARLKGIQELQVPYSTQAAVWNNEWVGEGTTYSTATDAQKLDPANYRGWQTVSVPVVNTDAMAFNDRPYTGGQIEDSVIKSTAVVWQGYLFDGHVVPMVGWRQDEDTARDAGSPIEANGIFYLGESNEWRLPNAPSDRWLQNQNPLVADPYRRYNVEKGDSLTKSLVVHMPRSWSERIGGVGVSLSYSESENFQPDASRIDLLGGTIASPKGTTKDYGITFSAFDERLIFKVNRYKTVVENATAGDEIGNDYFIGAAEGWGQQYAVQAATATGSFATVYGTATGGGRLTYQPERTLEEGETYTQAEIDATYAQQAAALDAWFANPVPASFQNTWGLSGYDAGSGSWSRPNGLAVTNTATSKGTEFELIASPTENWSIAVNASRTEATRTDLAQAYKDWINDRWELLQGPMGDVRLWGGGYSPSETVRAKYGREPIAGLALWDALEGSPVPELAKWRYSGVLNYNFNDGPLAGVNIGGSYRYQDAVVVSYPVITNSDGSEAFDVDNPNMGSSESNVDFWVGYERALTDRVDWRIQANVRNAFEDKKLYMVTAQPDGSAGMYRIGAPTTWTISNTFTF